MIGLCLFGGVVSATGIYPVELTEYAVVLLGRRAAAHLRNDTDLFVRYRRELVASGVFQMPESLGRSHIGASHTEDDIDRSLGIAEAALAAALDRGARRAA